MKLTKVGLVDDHIIIQNGVTMLLHDTTKIQNVEVIFAVSDGEQLIIKLKENLIPDIILLDIQMPKTDAFGVVEYIVANYKFIKILIFSMSSEQIYARRFQQAGAVGYLSKDASIEEILEALEAVRSDQTYFKIFDRKDYLI